jgi:hypothetical protein
MSSLAVQEEKQVARPLSVLVPLIQKDLEQAGEAAQRASMPYYKSAGDKMLEAKGQLSRGEFIPWLNRNFSISEQTARRYMSFAVATRDIQNEGSPSFSSLNDFHKQTGSSAYREVTSKKGWHEGVKSNIERARAEAQRIKNENLSRQQERDEERKLALKLIDIGFKVLAKELHPDKGGTRDAMSRLGRVRDRLKSHA